jgi:hypothetical protein
LLALGYSKRQRGSHATYSYTNCTPITVPIRYPFLLPIYVKQILERVYECGLLDKEDLAE